MTDLEIKERIIDLIKEAELNGWDMQLIELSDLLKQIQENITKKHDKRTKEGNS